MPSTKSWIAPAAKPSAFTLFAPARVLISSRSFATSEWTVATAGARPFTFTPPGVPADGDRVVAVRAVDDDAVLVAARAVEEHRVDAVLAFDDVAAVAGIPDERVVAGAHERDVIAAVPVE
jgi:hypothetical protein